jgi:ribosomal protein S18 acetylase RimI-like enzyme
MQAIIRKAQQQDVYAYAACQVASWRAAYKHIVPDEYLSALSAERRAEWLSQSLREDQTCSYYCMLMDEEIIGVLVLGKARDEERPNAGEIYAIYLLEAFWGQGFGAQLMRHAIESLRAMGYQEALLWALEENSRARRFYERAGFRPDGRQKEIVLGKPLTELCYTRPIGESPSDPVCKVTGNPTPL